MLRKIICTVLCPEAYLQDTSENKNSICLLISHHVLIEISFRKYMQNPNAIILCIQGKNEIISLISNLSLCHSGQP